MNVTLSGTPAPLGTLRSHPPEVLPATDKLRSAAPGGAPDLVISRQTARAEDVAAGEIPDAALSRDDTLGQLVQSAFNLPPPPMPAFPEQ